MALRQRSGQHKRFASELACGENDGGKSRGRRNRLRSAEPPCGFARTPRALFRNLHRRRSGCLPCGSTLVARPRGTREPGVDPAASGEGRRRGPQRDASRELCLVTRVSTRVKPRAAFERTRCALVAPAESAPRDAPGTTGWTANGNDGTRAARSRDSSRFSSASPMTKPRTT